MASPAYRLQITVQHATGLRDADTFGRSDPYCVCKVSDGKRKVVAFQTDTVNGSVDPVWNHQATVEVFRPTQALLFEVYDDDSIKGFSIRPDVLLGYATLSAGDFLGGGHFSYEMPLVDGDGMLVVHIAPSAVPALGSLAATHGTGQALAATPPTTTVAHVFEQPAPPAPARPQIPEAPTAATPTDEAVRRSAQALEDLQRVLDERLSGLERRVERNELFQSHMAKHCAFPPWRPSGSCEQSAQYGGRVHRSGGGGAWMPGRRSSSLTRCAGSGAGAGRRRRGSSKARQQAVLPGFGGLPPQAFAHSHEDGQHALRPGSAPVGSRRASTRVGFLPPDRLAPYDPDW